MRLVCSVYGLMFSREELLEICLVAGDGSAEIIFPVDGAKQGSWPAAERRGASGRSSDRLSRRRSAKRAHHPARARNSPLRLRDAAAVTTKPSESFYRMASKRGNPGMDTLAAIFRVIRKRPGIDLRVHTVKVAQLIPSEPTANQRHALPTRERYIWWVYAPTG